MTTPNRLALLMVALAGCADAASPAHDLGAAAGDLAAARDLTPPAPTPSDGGADAEPAAITIAPADYAFGAVTVGAALDQPFTITTSTPGAALTVAVAGSDAADFTVVDDQCSGAPDGGSGCMVTVRFAPTAAAARAASLTVTSASGAAAAALSGTGIAAAQVSAQPPSGAFGPVAVDTSSAEQTFVITNNGGSATGVFSVALTGSDAGQFVITTKTCDSAMLVPTALCSVKLLLHPTSLGDKSAALELRAAPGGLVRVPLTGSGSAPAQLALTSPAAGSFDFGAVAQNGSAEASFVVSNGGGAPSGPVTAALAGTDAAHFAITQDCAAAPLAPVAACTLKVTFNPDALRAYSAQLTISGTPGGAVMLDLAGTGAPPAALAVSGPAAFGPIADGASSADQTYTVSNTGGVPSAPVAATLTGTDAALFAVTSNTCSAALAAAGQPANKCRVKITFNPLAATPLGSKNLTLHVVAGALTADYAITGRAVGPSGLTIAGTAQFGTLVSNGANFVDQPFTVTNNGAAPSGALTVALSDATQFSFTTDCGAALDVAATCTVTVRWQPLTGTSGATTTTLSVVEGAGDLGTQKVLRGTAQAPAKLVWSPASRNFGNIKVSGQSNFRDFTLTNVGDVTSQAITITDAGDTAAFDRQLQSCGPNGTVVLAGGATCTVRQRFAPNSPGVKTLIMTASDGATSADANLTGNGRWLLQLAFLSNKSGHVTSSPAGIDCADPAGDCSELYDNNTVVTLTGVDTAYSTWDGWSGCTSGAAVNPCTVTLTAGVAVNGVVTVTVDFDPVLYAVTVTRSALNGGDGTVLSEAPLGTPDALLDCGSTCTHSYKYGDVVTLHATPSSAFNGLAGWSGACTGSSPICQLTITAATEVGATFTPYNKAFVSSQSYDGNLGGLAGADAKCAALAQAANLGGTNWKALLSSSTAAFRDRFTGRGWVRVDGRPLVDTMQAARDDGQQFYPLDLIESGAAVSTYAWTGATNDRCSDWTANASSGRGSSGWAATGTGQWLFSTAFSCDHQLPLYCLQDDFSVPLLPAPPAGTFKRAFVSATASAALDGLAAFDARCQSDAVAAGLTGTFRALIATSTATAASRFSTGPWVRLDNIPLFTLADLQQGSALAAAFDVQSNGSYLSATNVLAGSSATNLAGTATSTCGDWSAGSASNARTANSAFTSGWFGSVTAYACDTLSGPLYCLED